MRRRELKIYANNAIRHFCQQLRTGPVLHAETLEPITPKVFPKQDCFHRYYWKSMSLHQEKQLPDKGMSAAGTALPAQSTSIIAL